MGLKKESHIHLNEKNDQPRIEIFVYPATEEEAVLTFKLNEVDKNYLIKTLETTSLPYRIKHTADDDYKIFIKYKNEQKSLLMPFLFDYVIDQLKINNPNELSGIEFSMLDYCEHKLKTQSFESLYEHLKAWNKGEEVDNSLPDNDSLESKTGKFKTFNFPLTSLGIICEKQEKFGEALLCYAMANNTAYLKRAWWKTPGGDEFIIQLSRMMISAIEKDPKSENYVLNILKRLASAYQKIFIECLLDHYNFDKTFKIIDAYVKHNKKNTWYDTYSCYYRYLANILLRRGLKKEAALCFAILSKVESSIDLASTVPILGDSTSCMVYGTSNSHYMMISDLLDAYNFSDFPFYENTFTNMRSTTNKTCKSTITRLIAKNYELALENKPLIPLLFCVSYENKKTNEKHAIDVAIITSPISSRVTSAELRHCYRIANEMPPDIQAIARQTIKFIHVSQNGHVFDLKQIDPVWANTDFDTALNEYQKARANRCSKLPSYSWRQYLLQTTAIARERFRFFNPDVPQDNALHCDKKRRLS